MIIAYLKNSEKNWRYQNT